jgi:hypothetical protein
LIFCDVLRQILPHTCHKTTMKWMPDT